MDAPGNVTALQGLLGYLNFSTGRPDPRAQAQVFAAWQAVGHDPAPWLALHRQLASTLAELHAGANPAFRDVQQASAAIDLALVDLPTAYRRHHADLLAHQTDANLFQAGFVVRALEAVLAQQGPWDERDRILAGALKQLNDYVGHRPVAVLETRPRGEPYEHEKVCAMPLYLRGAGAAPGRYAALIARAIEILQAAPDGIRAQAQFDLDQLDELACDPRAYDHNHPADKRPNYRFGEWDPHLIDNRGFYRRLVVRQTILEAFLDRLEHSPQLPSGELLEEGATVLAALVLMASGLSGRGPDGHDSSVTLAGLLPSIAAYRDAFYSGTLKKMSGAHAERLRQEAANTRQPFGGARQHLNHYVARERAAQMQQRHLALLVAELGYPDAARRHAARVPAASQRMVTEIHASLVTARVLADAGKHAEAATQLATAEETLHKAIACGAMLDPWNILGFQGVYPLFNNREESVPDPRVPELVHAVERLLATFAHLRTEAAAAGDVALAERLVPRLQRLAAWWDRFATTTVHGVRHVSGRDVAASADHVAEALTRWRERGETTSDLAFWRQQLEHFRTTKAFALVVDALLHKRENRAAMALLMNWLGQAEEVPLEDGEHSFNLLAVRWMLGVVHDLAPANAERAPDDELVRKFMDYLEANAGEYWQVPRLERPGGAEELPPPEEDEEDALYGAAYEGVVYRDSTDDGNDAELLGFEPTDDFDLADEPERLGKRLRFLSMLFELFYLASRHFAQGVGHDASALNREAIQGWLSRGRKNYQDLVALLDAIHERPIPAPSGTAESLVEFDRRHVIKQQLLEGTIGTCLEAALVVGTLQGFALGDKVASPESELSGRERSLLQLEQAVWRGDADAVRGSLPLFLEHFQREPLMFTPLQQGGHPRQILRASIAQTLLRALVANLPRLGLLRETYGLLRIAQTMEREQKLEGPRVTEYPRLVQIGCHACVEAVVATITDAAVGWSDAERVGFLARFIEPFLKLWNEHSRSMRLSILETVTSDAAWAEQQDFVRKFGGGLFNNGAFMNLGNLRGILQRGVGPYLKYLQEHADPHKPLPLVAQLERGLDPATAVRHLQTVLQAVLENFEEFKDYNNSTTQSDQGENFHVLLDFLRLKAAYERQAWQIRPLLQVHEVLVRHHVAAAALWHRQIELKMQPVAESFVGRLADLERSHGLRLRTVSDRIHERFVQPLALDRVSALIEPAYDAARSGRSQEALVELEAGLQPYLDAPIGSGLDVPVWVRRLEGELQRVKMRHTAVANLAENLLQVPRIPIPVEQLRQQLEDWPKP